jgi:hypothetical protein
MKRIIWSLDLKINDVVYLRRDGKVIGAKYLGLESDAESGEYTTLRFYRADGKTENIRLCNGSYFDSEKLQVYATIEDAIHKKPIGYRSVDITNLTKDEFGFTHTHTRVSTSIGCLKLGKFVWIWDGYKPVKKHIWHTNYKITYDGEWGCEYIGKLKYYATEEECRCDNHVDVVTF